MSKISKKEKKYKLSKVNIFKMFRKSKRKIEMFRKVTI